MITFSIIGNIYLLLVVVFSYRFQKYYPLEPKWAITLAWFWFIAFPAQLYVALFIKPKAQKQAKKGNLKTQK